jgi:hypothetical protein
MMRHVLLIAAITLGLTGCGGAPKQQAGPPAAVGVYTSAVDCAESKKLPVDVCNQLIHAAVAEHQNTTKTYISLRLCEISEGDNYCERTEENAYRPKLQAFLVTFSSPPQVQPLYVSAEHALIGFSSLDKKRTVLAVDETLLFSDHAKFVAEGNVK